MPPDRARHQLVACPPGSITSITLGGPGASRSDPFRDVVRRAARSVVGQLNVDQLLQQIVDEAAALLNVDHGFINVIDRASRTMQVGYARGVFREIAGMRVEYGRGIAGRVWETGRGLIVNDYGDWPDRIRQGVPVEAMIAVPLRNEQEIHGVLALAENRPGYRFTTDQLDLLSGFAELASIAMVNAQLHAELKRSRQRYRSVVHDQTEMVARFQPDGTITFANDACARAFGSLPEQMIGRSVYELIDPADRERTRNELAALTPEQPLRHCELQITGADGKTRWQAWIDRGLFDDRGRLVEVQAVGRDVTEQKHAADALARSEARYRTLFNATPSGLLVEDRHGTIVDVNDAVCRMLGYRRDELVGRHVSMLTDVDRAIVEGNISRVLDAETLRHEVMNIGRDGARRYVELLETRFDLPDGEPGILVVSQDVTERKQSTEALKRSERRARRLANRLETLLHELDHRVKNNLVGLMTLVAIYARSKTTVTELAEALTGKLEAMRTVHDRLSRRQWRSVELGELVEQLVGCDPGPGEADRITCHGPAVQIPASQAGPLAMVVQELLTNARKHGALTGSRGRVAVVWQFDPVDARLEIDWRETHAEPLPPGPGKGQGLRLIEGLVEADLRGRCRFDFTDAGLRCAILCRLELVEATDETERPDR